MEKLHAEAWFISPKITDRLDVCCKVSELSVAEKQSVSLARALARNPKVLILDKSTASLGDRVTREFSSVLRQLKKERTSILYISDRLQEIFDLAEKVSVLVMAKK